MLNYRKTPVFIRIKDIVEGTNSLSSKLFDWSIQLLIVVSIITFSIKTLPNLDTDTVFLLSFLEFIIVGIFIAEYAVRVFIADRKRDYVFSVYGIIDILAIIPSIISLGEFGLLFLRIFRLVKLLKYNKAAHLLVRGFVLIKDEMILFFVVIIVLLYLTACGIYYFEHNEQPEVFQSIFHSLWWAVATITTVGYGDVYPVTAGGKFFTAIVLMIGLSVVAIPAGLLASALPLAKTEIERETADNPSNPSGVVDGSLGGL